MGRINIAFLWHMHQPYYRDPLKGVYSLPWVRMHALRGYYDMISILEGYPDIRQTFNLVPSLLAQLEDYVCEEARDSFLEHTRKPAADLSPDEKKFILANFFMCHWETMVKPYSGYWGLLLKRGMKVPADRWDDLLSRFSVQDLRDLQVWFNLTWFGHQAREKKRVIGDLLGKGRHFSEEDKQALLQVQQEILRELLPLYQSARSRGQVEISFTPFYHPILPLLVDWRSACRAMPELRLPGSFSHPEDARAQIDKAVAFYERIFGTKPAGMWPAEGSVSPEIIPLVQEAGVRWMATDEGILFKSLPAPADRNRLYRPYRARFQDAEISMVFRDRNLSDLIGFTYAKNNPEASVADLLAHLQNIRRSCSGDSFVLIALDGENPWEYYPDGGREFLRRLYDGLSTEHDMETVRIHSFLGKNPPADTIQDLYTGSWIDQNFHIWIGSPEDHQACNVLNQTRQHLEKAAGDLSPEARRLAWEEIYTAEGSDWFWWYGDEFTSDNNEEFDRLFRMHLANVYALLGEEIPESLQTPIVSAGAVKPVMEPMGFLSPVIDGRISHFYEWQGAGYYSAQTAGGSMYRGETFISGIYYGFDAQRLHFRIDPVLRNAGGLRDLRFHLRLLAKREWCIVFPFVFPEGEPPSFLLFEGPGNGGDPKRFTTIAAEQIFELAISFSDLGFRPHENVRFFLRLQKGPMEVERHPRTGYLSIDVPDKDFERILWQV